MEGADVAFSFKSRAGAALKWVTCRPRFAGIIEAACRARGEHSSDNAARHHRKWQRASAVAKSIARIWRSASAAGLRIRQHRQYPWPMSISLRIEMFMAAPSHPHQIDKAEAAGLCGGKYEGL